VQADRVLILTGDKERDRAAIGAVLKPEHGLHPEDAAPIDWKSID
jgi:hypothetical protein